MTTITNTTVNLTGALPKIALLFPSTVGPQFAEIWHKWLPGNEEYYDLYFNTKYLSTDPVNPSRVIAYLLASATEFAENQGIKYVKYVVMDRMIGYPFEMFYNVMCAQPDVSFYGQLNTDPELCSTSQKEKWASTLKAVPESFRARTYPVSDLFILSHKHASKFVKLERAVYSGAVSTDLLYAAVLFSVARSGVVLSALSDNLMDDPAFEDYDATMSSVMDGYC